MIIKLPANLNPRTRRLPQVLVLLFAFVMTGTFAFLMAKNPETTSAVDLSGFRAGNIISDYVMSNYTSMSEGDIQNFLKSKNSCNDTNWDKYQYYSAQGYSYHWDNGHFVCMADENFGGESAAHIIWQAAQDYQINPQVLIVLLQKEQSLITDTWPNSRQLDYAVGYGCPDDSEGCRSERAGFRKQIRWAAELFREVLNGGWTNYPVGYNYIRYNPSDSCGGSTVYIETSPLPLSIATLLINPTPKPSPPAMARPTVAPMVTVTSTSISPNGSAALRPPLRLTLPSLTASTISNPFSPPTASSPTATASKTPPGAPAPSAGKSLAVALTTA